MADDTNALDWLEKKQKKYTADPSVFTRLRNGFMHEIGENGTLRDVCRLSEVEWFRAPNFGRKSLNLLTYLLYEDGLKLNGQHVQIALKEFEEIKAERDLLKARQKAIYLALVAKEFDGDKPLPNTPRPNPAKDHSIAELENQLIQLTSRFNAATRILWLIARSAGGKYTFNTLPDPSGLGGCPLAPGLSVDAHGEGVMTITALGNGGDLPI